MTVTALAIITDAYERCNRLSPGEALNDDDAAFGLRRLNILVDELSAKNLFLYKTILTSVSQTSHITLGSGSWAAIAQGDYIFSATAAGQAISPITMQQYNGIYDKTVAGTPSLYAQDGLGNVYLYPVPTAITIELQTRTGVAEFADQTTAYTVPDGYKAMLGASLAVRIAPGVLGTIPPALLKAEAKCMMGVSHYNPAVLNVGSYTSSGQSTNIMNW